jgi:hypothetical protein
MANDLQELIEQAASPPRASSTDIDRIMERARRLRVRAIARRVVGAVAAGLLIAAVSSNLADTGTDAPVRINPATSTLQVPARGVASPQLLRDGTPVWVVHHRDDSLTVLSARSTHAPAGIAQLVGWCPSSRRFEDGMYGSQWDERGRYRGGPAPSDLAYAKVQTRDEDQVAVGPLITRHRRTAAELPKEARPPPAASCFANLPSGYDPGTTKRHHFTNDQRTSFSNLRRQISRHDARRLLYLTDAVVVVTATGPAQLCASAQFRATRTCHGGIPITDFGAAFFRERYRSGGVIRGPLLVRPTPDAVQELTYVDGYETTQTPP